MLSRFSFRDFTSGVVVGLALGSAGLAVATPSYEGWQRFSQDFKIGYLQGFLDMANVARNLEPGGYVDSRWPLIPGAKPSEWAAAVDVLYTDPKHQGYRMATVLELAAQELEKKFGKPLDAQERTRRRMEHQIASYTKKREAMGLNKPGEPPAPEPKLLEAKEKTVAAPKPPKEPEPRKWCRCDGKDPKAERAKRRAAAEQKAAAEKAAGKAGAPAGEGKTPPAPAPKADAPKPAAPH